MDFFTSSLKREEAVMIAFFLRRVCFLLSLLVPSLFVTGCDQSDKDISSMEKIASYEGGDRGQRLIAAAKKEGSLSFYTSLAAQKLEKIAADFENRYGIKVNTWRAGDDKVLQRILIETKAGRFDFDAVHMESTELEALHREKLLQEIKSPYLKDLIPEAVPPHRQWAPTVLNVIVQAYNTDKVKKTELPKTYEDLLDPRWRGRLGFESKDQEWFYTVVKDMGEERGLKFFKDLVSRNGLSVRSGHSLLNNLTASGEIPLALTVYSHMPMLAKREGASIDWFVIEPAIAISFGVGVSQKAPHPNAAVLFYDYMINDAQQLLASMDYVPTNKKVASPLQGVQIKLVDPAVVLDSYEKWNKLYEEIILRPKPNP